MASAQAAAAVIALGKYRPHTHQARLHASGARWLIALAGARSGKTSSCGVEFLSRAFRDVEEGRFTDVPATGSRRRRPRWHGWIVAPTYPLLAEPRRRILELLDGSGLVEGYYEHDGQLWLRGGILIEFRGTENIHGLVSVGLRGLWADEADRIAADAFRGQLRQRLAEHQGWGVFSSTPWACRAGYLYEDFISRKDEDPSIGFFTWPSWENPHIPAAEVTAARESLPKRYFDREWAASLDAFVGLVFELKDEVHILSDKRIAMQYGCHRLEDLKSKCRRVHAGQDFGFASPGALVVVGDMGDQLIALEEVYASGKPIFDPSRSQGSWVDECHRLRQKWGVSQFVYDPSGAEYAYQLQRTGLTMLPGRNDISSGIRRIEEALMIRQDTQRPGLVISDRCTNLIREMKALKWDQQRDGSLKETPKDGNDHAVDALKYVVGELRHYAPTGYEKPRAARSLVY